LIPYLASRITKTRKKTGQVFPDPLPSVRGTQPEAEREWKQFGHEKLKVKETTMRIEGGGGEAGQRGK